MSTPRGLARNTRESGWVQTASLFWQTTAWPALSGNWAVWPTKQQRRRVSKCIFTLALISICQVSKKTLLGSLTSLGCRCRTTWFRHVLAVMDLTVFPANAALVRSAMTVMCNVLNLGANNIGHVQLPISTPNPLFLETPQKCLCLSSSERAIWTGVKHTSHLIRQLKHFNCLGWRSLMIMDIDLFHSFWSFFMFFCFCKSCNYSFYFPLWVAVSQVFWLQDQVPAKWRSWSPYSHATNTFACVDIV